MGGRSSLYLFIWSIKKKNNRNIWISGFICLIFGAFLWTFNLVKADFHFKYPNGFEVSIKGENFKATNENLHVQTILVTVASDHPSPQIHFIDGSDYIKEELSRSNDGSRRFFVVKLPPGKKLTGKVEDKNSVVNLTPYFEK